MKHFEKFALFLSFSGVILCIISIFTPAAFFENRAWDHTILYWLWGFKYEKFVHYHDERDSAYEYLRALGLRNFPEKFIDKW